jgi:uncharacterized protein YndB with AHSA1/START domain
MSSAPGSTFIYVTYIRTTPAKLWEALTDPEIMCQYWFNVRGVSDWKKGSPWKLVADDGSIYDEGEILEADPPRKLSMRWQNKKKPELTAEGFSVCTMELEPVPGAVKLTITHSIDKKDSKLIEAVSGGWPKVLSNLKSLLEGGQITMPEAYPQAAR